jgi:hypothetical protein
MAAPIAAAVVVVALRLLRCCKDGRGATGEALCNDNAPPTRTGSARVAAAKEDGFAAARQAVVVARFTARLWHCAKLV